MGRAYKRELEYLESTGTQWIDTNIVPSPGMDFEVKFRYTGPAAQRYIFGLFEYGAQVSAYWLCFNSNGKLGYNNGQYNITLANGVSTTSGTVYVAKRTSNGFYLNGTFVSSTSVSGYNYQHSIPLFIRHNYNATPEYELPGTGVRIYYAILGDHELIPAIDNNNVPCMYDKATGQCLYNQGTGDFLYKLMPNQVFSHIPCSFPTPMGNTNGLLDQYTKFFLYGPYGVHDIAEGTAINNFGLVRNGDYIEASTDSSYAVIPANELNNEVFVSGHDWTFEMVFWVPESLSISATKRLFGGQSSTLIGRFDCIIPATTVTFAVGSLVEGLPLNYGGDNSIKVVFTANPTRFRYSWNGGQLQVTQYNSDTYKNLREQDNGIMAAIYNSGTYPCGTLFKLKYIRISNVART